MCVFKISDVQIMFTLIAKNSAIAIDIKVN